MDPQDRVWHDTMRPTWGPNGTLVFAANPSEAAFGRSGRVTERNGLMMVMKGGVVSESQDIRIAKFTNEVRVSISSQKNMVLTYHGDGCKSY